MSEMSLFTCGPRAKQGYGLVGRQLVSLPQPPQVIIREVVLRDGLQQERISVSVDKKLELIEALIAAGIRELEIASFVSPGRVPAMADAEELFRRVTRKEGVRFSGLVFNQRGFERALQVGVDEIAVFVSASESHSRRNVGMGMKEALKEARRVIRAANQAGIRVRCGISTAFGCAIEGTVAVGKVVDLSKALVQEKVHEMTFADTSGMANPRQIGELLSLCRAHIGEVPVSLHLHNASGWAFANLLAGMQMGVVCFDASLGGLGGCPFLPGASGNVPTEQVNAFFLAMGSKTGIDPEGLRQCLVLLRGILGR